MATSHNSHHVYKQSDPLNSPFSTIRIRYGLTWRKSYPGAEQLREVLRYTCYICLIILAYGIVGRLDYEDEMITARIVAEQHGEMQQARMLACLNGGMPGYYTTDLSGTKHYVVCETYTISNANVKGAM